MPKMLFAALVSLVIFTSAYGFRWDCVFENSTLRPLFYPMKSVFKHNQSQCLELCEATSSNIRAFTLLGYDVSLALFNFYLYVI